MALKFQQGSGDIHCVPGDVCGQTWGWSQEPLGGGEREKSRCQARDALEELLGHRHNLGPVPQPGGRYLGPAPMVLFPFHMHGRPVLYDLVVGP